MHSIHGRAPAIATGLAASRPDLSVWVIGGDGDFLSIGGNHLIHALRRNVNLKLLLFNNRIYGLTKGQYSPTSEVGKITKSTPVGSVDTPFNPVSLALGAEATFVARTIDSDRKHLTAVLRAAAEHRGTAFVEILQNCDIFNDHAFDVLKNPDTRDTAGLRLEHGEQIRFGKDREKGVRLSPAGGLAIVAGLGDDRANAAPSLPGANSPYQIVFHCCGMLEWWTREAVLGVDVGRDRDAEFVARGSVADLAARVDAVRSQLHADLGDIA